MRFSGLAQVEASADSIVFAAKGPVIVTTGSLRYVILGAGSITDVIMAVGTAPVGPRAGVEVNVLVNGASILTPTVAVSAGQDEDHAHFDPPISLAADDHLTVDITGSRGSTIAADLTVGIYGVGL